MSVFSFILIKKFINKQNYKTVKSRDKPRRGSLTIIKRFTVGVLHTNCYVVGCEKTGKALVIDPGFYSQTEAERFLKNIEVLNLQLSSIINTHAHHDHVSGNRIVKRATGASLMIHEYDSSMLLLPVDRILHEGDIVQVGDVKLNVLYTPGHTRGSICLIGDDFIFTGDTLFAGSVGSGDLKTIVHSIKSKLLPLQDHIKIYPGHGPTSTIGEEKEFNPFLRDI
jgi:glyoxylase-like metal-dependent hydrolase (beta-lactamase superfamily II)